MLDDFDDAPVPLSEFVMPRKDARRLTRGLHRQTRVVVTIWSDGSATLRYVIGQPDDSERARHIATMCAWWERCSQPQVLQ